MLEVEEKVNFLDKLKLNHIIKGHLTSGLKGGVKICKTPDEVKNFTKQMIGYNLITHQTVKEGLNKENYFY